MRELALELYARQAKDAELEMAAAEIRTKVIRWVSFLSREMRLQP